MVNEFEIQVKHELGSEEPVVMWRIFKKVKDRCDVCRIPQCWLLKYPGDDGQIYLPRQFFRNARRGKAVTIKQALFRLAYNESPPVGQPLRNICDGGPLCVNPAHLVTRTWRPTYAQIFKMVGRGWLTWEQADEWYADVKPENE
jgi:hypothetical protein